MAAMNFDHQSYRAVPRFRSSAILLFAGLAAGLFTGCPESKKQDQQPVEQPFAGQQIQIRVPEKFRLPAVWEGLLNEWSAQTGAKCELQESPGNSEETKAKPIFADGATLAIFPISDIGELVGQLAPIPESSQGAETLNWVDLFSGLREGLASPGKKPSIVPIACPVLVCYYRKDLLDKAKLAPPQTWEDYQQLLDKLGEWAPGLTAVEPWSEEFRATMFLARSVAFAKHPGHFSLFFDIENGKPLIDSPGFAHGLETAKSAIKKLSPEVQTLSPAACRNAIVEGKAALAIGYEAEDPHQVIGDNRPVESARAADTLIGVCRLPGTRETYNPTRKEWEPIADKGVHYVTLAGFAGWCAAVSAEATPLQAEAAWNVFAKLAGSDFSSGFPTREATLCRESQMLNPAWFVETGLSGAEAGGYISAVATSLRDSRVVVELPVNRLVFRAALSEAITSCVFGETSAPTALEDAARKWTAIGTEFGIEKVRDNYRSALGLQPLAKGRN